MNDGKSFAQPDPEQPADSTPEVSPLANEYPVSPESRAEFVDEAPLPDAAHSPQLAGPFQISPEPWSPAPADLSLPEDLRAPWGWLDLALLVAITFGGIFLFSVILVIIFSAFGIGPSQVQKSAEYKGIFAVVTQTLLSLGLLAYLAAQMRLRFRRPFWRTIGWRPLDPGLMPRYLAYFTWIVAGFAFSLLITIASSALGHKAQMPIEGLFQNRVSALLLMSMGILIAPVFEETIFRGYIYPVIARSWGVTASVLVTGTIFGLLHAPQLWGGWAQIGLLVIVGIVFTLVRAITKTVVASYLLHVSYNSFLFLAFLFASGGLRHLPIVH